MNRDFVEMLSALSAERARFLVVGAYALAAHGTPRATGDLDIFIDRAPDNAARVLAALRAFGAPLLDLTAADLRDRAGDRPPRVHPQQAQFRTSEGPRRPRAARRDRTSVRDTR